MTVNVSDIVAASEAERDQLTSSVRDNEAVSVVVSVCVAESDKVTDRVFAFFFLDSELVTEREGETVLASDTVPDCEET